MESWVVVLIVLIVIVTLIVINMVRDKKAGKCSCGHGCQNCAMHGQCNTAVKKNENN